MLAASRLLDRAGAHSRYRGHLQARRARTPYRAQFAGGAGGGIARRRRSGARGTGARRDQAADWARRAQHARTARRHRAADRRELQRKSGLDARGTRLAGPSRCRFARPTYRRARRHAGTRRPRGGLASGTPRAAAGRWRGSRILLWAADAGAVGGSSLRTPRRLCRDFGDTGIAITCRGPPRRRGHGQGVPGIADGAAREGTAASVSARGSARRAGPTFNRYRLTHALLAFGILRHDWSAQRPALHHV